MKHNLIIIIFLAFVGSVCACGQTGRLYLPTNASMAQIEKSHA